MRISAAGAHIAALCDVEGDRPLGWFMRDLTRRFPQARFYRDFRTLLEKEGPGLDAVVVSTPDHNHCAPAVTAMRMGKHVYCQKPLAHSIAEARLMAETARLHGVATQMGNQAHANEVVRRGVELIRGGIIERVREVHAWTNRPIWPQGMATRPPGAPVPASLDWDLWLGPAPDRPYARGYCPFAWRGWWDFGTGALGDMACHILDMPYWALELDAPTRVEAMSEGGTEEAPPRSSIVTFRFPAGSYHDELRLVWYDGGHMPPESVLGDVGVSLRTIRRCFDLVMIGSEGKLLFHRDDGWLVTPERRLEAVREIPVTLPRVSNDAIEWIDACRGGPPALSSFAASGPFTEAVLTGNLALRLGEAIDWDGPLMQARNAPQAGALIRPDYAPGWEL
jgi:predicted dehydrogenase